MKIHGNVKLKLKDARTGRVLRTEEGENTFQAAVLADYLAADGDNSNDLYANTSFKAEPWKYLCGGLLLFRDQIEVGSKVMPAGNVMTGKASAGIVNNGSPTELGSWNDTLSNASFDGEKMQKVDCPAGMRLKRPREVALINYTEWIKFQKYAETNL